MMNVSKKKNFNRSSYMSAVNRIAHRIRKVRGLNWSEALKSAHAMLRNNKAELVTFSKVSGEQTTRVVCFNWAVFVEPKGSGRPRPAGLKVAADLAKVAAGEYPVISFYENRVLASEAL